ncbi:hypothetical protein [Thermomonas hydrothermalis]|uniref:Uncharacterized protein n=1 Tax=Thermomonas hydrothermalis TaxID=213588 RepID=A0A1M4SY42_9GAMM|nr:hypothetical protein [Thermomonas hydrothermalis]SHE37121.1 hypothetical protein SAMN02745204_00314 [Thermomonas hydrothermalis]
MTRFTRSRSLPKTLLLATLAMSGLHPAMAQDADIEQRDRWQRHTERTRALPEQEPVIAPAPALPRANASVPQPRPAPPATAIDVQPLPSPSPAPGWRMSRGMDEPRRENWGELARQQLERERPPQTPPPLPRAEVAYPPAPRRLPIASDSPPEPQDAEMPRMAGRASRQVPEQREVTPMPPPPEQPAQTPQPRSPQAWAIQQALAREQENARRNEPPPMRPGWPPGQRNDEHRIPDAERQRRIEEHHRQYAEWQREEARRRADYDRERERLERERRLAQSHYQHEYWRRWLELQLRWNDPRFDPDLDPFFYTPYSYRYAVQGRWYWTNSYGAEVLRQAVRYGYREGWYAGRADREDHWRFDYRNNYAWVDASFGYPGRYVSFDAYRYYFRQGFERGYRDGYAGRPQYGYFIDGDVEILPSVLGGILTFRIAY